MCLDSAAAPVLLPTEPPDAWEYSLQIPHDPLGPGIARATVRTVLTGHGLHAMEETAELLTSELATNAFRHSRGPASVRLKWLYERLRVSVWDTDPRRPALSAPGADSERGRGLLLLEACADTWGSFALASGLLGLRGKVVWFELVSDVPAA